MYPGQRQATLRSQTGCGTRNTTSGAQRRASTYIDPNPGSFSAPVARLSKWPKNVFFASDFIAEKAAVTASTSARRRRPRRRTCSSSDDARKATERGRRKARAHESATRHRISKDPAKCRSSDGEREGPPSTQGGTEREEIRPDVARGEEEGNFLEESASALLLLHSRFFGGVSQEEDIVCRLCMLCREARWMGNTLGACPGLDPLVLEKMAVARLRSADHCDLRWQRKSSGSHSKSTTFHSEAEEEVLSFEAFYRILADIATLIYPHERKAMQRLLLEGVLPLAATCKPRMWSPRPELLYGRPALAALRMQRDALRQLYCTYERIARTESGAGGISRSIFLKMLADLGVTPVSASEEHAASVFDDALRNGLADPESPFTRKPQKEIRATRLAGEGRVGFMEVGYREGVPLSSGQPWGDRLRWSSFLEAMAALAVGAVKEGHVTATTKDRNTTPVRRAGNWGKASLESNLGEPGEDAYEAPQRATPPDEGRYRERWIPRRTGTEFGCKSEDVKDGAGEKYSGRKESAGRRGVPSAGGRARAERGGQRATYGGSFYHDSRREVELMPTLRELDVPPEHPGSPVRSDPPYRLPQTPQGDTEVKLEPTDATVSKPSPTTTTERGTPTNARHVGDTTSPSRAVQNTPPDQARQTSENPSTEHRPAVKNKNKTATREAGEGEAMETADSAATATAAGGVGCLIPKEVVEIGQMTSFKVAGSRPKGGACTINLSEAPGRAPTAWPRAKTDVNVDILDGGSATEVVDGDARGGQQLVLIGLPSKRRGTPAAGNVTASTDPASAHHVQPERAHLPVPLSLKENGNDRGKDGGLSPAPYDGSSLFSVQQVMPPSSTTPAASEGLKGPPCHASALQDHGKQPSRPLPGLEGHAANPKPDESASFQPRSCGESTGLVTDTSSGGCSGQLARMVGATASHEPEGDGEKYPSLRVDDDPKMVQKKSLHPDWGRDGVKRKKDLDGNGRAPLREDCCSERRKGGVGREAPTEDVPMSLEAASATIFDELLEPRVVAVYSRYRKELVQLFRRYCNSVSPDSERFKYVNVMLMSDSGIWRFVGEFPVLARWAQGDSILRLIIRASRDRGWHRCRDKPESAGQPSGLTYFGFLEVLTRMAYASSDRSPLHRKLLAFMSALTGDDPRGILRF